MTDLEDKHEMVKPVDIDQEWVKEAYESGHEVMPLHIVDGNEDLEAEGQAVEIDFDKIKSREDINIDLDNVETEVLDTNGEMLCWLDLSELEKREQINIYYGVDER